MKLLTFSVPDAPSRLRIGLLLEQTRIIDLSRRLAALPSDMISLIRDWDQWHADVQRLERAEGQDYALSEVILQAPVQRPGKILGQGLNYADHIRESGHAPPGKQMWFAKMPTCINGPQAPILRPRVSAQLDYEAELVVVIGRRCRHVPVEQAADVIFGYCVGNDVSVRDWQRHTSQFTLGKSFDTHAPIGPWIVTRSELDDPHALDIHCRVNGELRQSSNTRELIFNCFDQVALLSQAMTLEPGDLLFTGTPGGVGAAQQPPRWLRAGDVVQVTIDRIGSIENPVVDEA